MCACLQHGRGSLSISYFCIKKFQISSMATTCLVSLMWLFTDLFCYVFYQWWLIINLFRRLTPFCLPFQHLLSVRLTSLGIIWEPVVPPLCRNTLSDSKCWNGGHEWVKRKVKEFIPKLWACYWFVSSN